MDDSPEDFALEKDNQQGGIQLAPDAARMTMALLLIKKKCLKD